jgi:hypothetical protein
VGHQDDGFGAILDSVLDGGEGAGDTLVVGDLGVGLLVEGNVEVDLKSLLSVLCTYMYRVEVFGYRHTRMRTRLPLRSTSVMESLLERDMIAVLGDRQ